MLANFGIGTLAMILVSTRFAADEAVLDYALGYVRPCACRAVGAR